MAKQANPAVEVQPDLFIERILSMEIARVTERAAVRLRARTGRREGGGPGRGRCHAARTEQAPDHRHGPDR